MTVNYRNSGKSLVRFTRRTVLAASAALALGVGLPGAANADLVVPEKDELKFGFIKLTDMAPLAVAKELGYFEDEGLYVTLEAQANWKV
ncbi:MAG: ABC transporter substrate-binding protein, partial [Pseudomonadota bacterium]